VTVTFTTEPTLVVWVVTCVVTEVEVWVTMLVEVTAAPVTDVVWTVVEVIDPAELWPA